MPSICTQNFKSKFASLKIERLILNIPLNTIDNRINEKFLRRILSIKPLWKHVHSVIQHC